MSTDDPPDERTLRVEDEETYRLLKAAGRHGETTAETIARLVQDRTEHTLTTDERAAYGWYVRCEDCGASSNSVDDMIGRPCE